ncbi:MAG: SIMPL domain-containing protein, partial [Cyanobium sp. MAG06]|nr:SIMPL domain-containing protein [Cyanobium sp. MAG06]
EEKLRAKAEKLFTSFDELEIEEKDIKTTNIYSQPKYSYPSCGFYGCEQPTILGYTHNESIAVKVRNIDNISKLTTLVSDNKIGSYYGPN